MAGRRVILCSLVLAWVSVSKSQNSFFVARQYRNYNNHVCVTNTSFALSWIQEPIKESLQQNSVYIPESKSTFNCEITNDSCTQNYFTAHPWSLQSGVGEIILDERWEEMKAIETEFVDGDRNATLKFEPLLKLHTPNFNVALSIRREKEGHIFLCDGENPSESNCYWFMLQAFTGKASAIRKCSEEKVPAENEVYPKISCKEQRISTQHPAFPFYLSSSKWSHFILSKQDGVLTFSLYADHKLVKILEWHDTEAPIVVTDMIVHGKMVDGLWKIHNLDFIATETRSNDVVLGGPIYAREGFVCISMYVSMCRSCKIKLSLTNQREIINDMTYETKHAGWKQIKFITANVSNSVAMQLLVSTISESPTHYWQVDKIRFCRQEEFRLIGLSEKATCQLMSGTDDIITGGELRAISENTCPEDTIGPFCVKCNLILYDCDKMTICSNAQCVCSAGHHGEDCAFGCVRYSYGHGCRKRCGKCYNICNYIDGTCSSCTNNYSGPKCDIPPSIIFAKPPKVTDITYDRATISVSDFKIENLIPGMNIPLYGVEYKEAKDPNSIWILYNTTFTFHEAVQFRIHNLNSQTQYRVRSVIYTVSQQWHTGEHLKYTEFTTKCQEITDNNIHIEAYNTSAFISLVQTTDYTCKGYTMSLYGIQSESYTNSTGTYFFGLHPFTAYSLKIQGPSRTHDKGFMTTVGVPNLVKNLLIYTKNETSISLRWQPPAPPTGVLKDYKIIYGHYDQRIYRRQELTVEPTSCKIWPQFYCITLPGLESNTQHTIQVSARNEDPDDFGPPRQVSTVTEIEDSRAPYDLKVYWTIHNHLVLEWKHPNQTNGDIQYFDITIYGRTVRDLIKKKFDLTSNLYNLTYFCKINASEFTPTEEYEVTIFAFNGKRGRDVFRATISPPEMLTTRAIHLLNISDHTVDMTIVLNKFEGETDTYRIIILRSDKESNLDSFYVLQKFDLRNLRVVIDCNFTNKQNSIFVILGQNEQSNGCHSINNSFLEPATSYNVTIILINTSRRTVKTSTNVYSMTIKTAGESNSALFALLLLLLIIPVVAFCYMKRTSIRSLNRQVPALNNSMGQSNVEQRTDRMPLVQLQPKVMKNILNQNTAGIHESGKDHSKVVSVQNFYSYFKTSLENGELNNQHENILQTVLTYETVLFDNLRSDFIDMNFNSGLQVKNAYLITKLPEVAEFNEFWKIVEDENIHHIILFAHLQPNQKKSTNYWPDVGKSLRCGNIIIECNMCQKYTFYTYRKFSLKCRNKIRQVHQLHLSLPRNDSRYLSSLNYMEFFQKMSQIPHSCRSPILVHSSAGMRGTSFALLCDMSLRRAQIDGAIDVMANFKTLIQTTTEMKTEFDHYVAAHAIIADILNHMDTGIACNSFDCSQSKLFSKEEIRRHLQYLKDTLWLDGLTIEAEKQCYINCPTILLKDGQVVQRDISSVDSQLEQSDFIKVGGFKTPEKFLVAKRPVSMPLSDFLEKIQQKKVLVIVSLNANIFTWPSENQPEMVLSGDITLKYKFIKKLRSYDWITLELKTKTTCQIVEVVTFRSWSAPVVALPKIADFVNFVTESSEIFQNVEPVLVTCHDGVTSCGLYLAMWSIIQQIKTESVCDVCMSIRRLRRHCQDFVKDDKQYVFLLEAAHDYMKQFTLYEVR